MLYQLLANLVNRLDRDEQGATAVEYGLMVAAIAAVIILAVMTLGDQVNAVFGFVTGQMDQVTP